MDGYRIQSGIQWAVQGWILRNALNTGIIAAVGMMKTNRHRAEGFHILNAGQVLKFVYRSCGCGFSKGDRDIFALGNSILYPYDMRSEERRVGKECRSRVVGDH